MSASKTPSFTSMCPPRLMLAGGVPGIQLLALRQRLKQQEQELAKVDSELTRLQGQVSL